ncbi:MAG: ATP-binding protein [Burkholderiaceae bacterium]
MRLSARLRGVLLDRLERLIGLASFVCAAVVIAATVSHALQLRDAIRTAAEGRLLTISRILAKEVNRTLGQTRGMLEQVNDALRDSNGRLTPQIDTVLEGLLRQHALLREVAVVDLAGRIVASSNRRNVGVDVGTYDFIADPQGEVVRVGLPKAGRSFARGAAAAEGPGNAFDGFLTVTRATSADADALNVVAVIGTHSLIGELRHLAGDDAGLITLYRYDGALLATSDMAVGRRSAPHPIFTRFLPAHESGGYEDRPGDARAWLAHFDTSADFPVIVEVRMPSSLVIARWERELMAPLLILLVTLAAVAGFTRISSRAMQHRARSEEQAATQERRLRNILDTAADGIVTIDGKGVIREYNRAAESIFGVPAGEAVGRPLAELLPADHALEHQQRVEAYLASGNGSIIGRGRVIRTTRRDGRPMELHLAISEVVDQDEHLFTGIVRDVTEVRQAEQRFRTLFLRSGEPHLLFDGNGGLIDCNDAAAILLRAPGREPLLGLTLAQLAAGTQADGDADVVLADATAAARRDGVRRLVWAARALDDTEFPVEMTLTPIRLGDSDAMLVAWHDIAERQRYEQELRRARDAAESAASAKAQFLAMMSHELRTPMTGIIGMVDLLQDARMSDEQKHFVSVLRSSAQSLLTVLNDVLDYSKIEAGRLQLESIDFRPADIAREVVELLSQAASQRGNTLSAQWRPGAAQALAGDPTRLRQVLFNLVGNAIKFTERGQVTIEGDTRTMPDGKVMLTFEVVDTGVGIAPDVLPTLFRPFQQADSSTTRRFGGTGLGLAICRHLVEAMGGRIEVESRPGEGSTFRISAPLEPATGLPPETAHEAAALPSVRAMRLLVAEDNPTNRLLIGTRLRRAGHSVDLVENGLRAVDAARDADWDLILMDMQMPELDGVGATRAIRALPGPRSRVPIVALTADALPEFRERYMSSGLDDYMTKPIDWVALDRVLRRYTPAVAPTASVTSDVPTAAMTADLPPPESRPDEAPVASMKDDLGDDTWAIVLEVYWPKAQTDLEDCRSAVERDDATARRAAAHSLKGASASLGFESVAALAATMEHCDAARARVLIDELEAAFAAVRAAWYSDAVAAAD